MTETNDFEAYVALAWGRLLRSAWLLTGDWHRAEDLVQTVLARAYGRWPRLRDGAPDAYLRAMLATTYLSWWRRKWRDEVPVEEPPPTTLVGLRDIVESVGPLVPAGLSVSVALFVTF